MPPAVAEYMRGVGEAARAAAREIARADTHAKNAALEQSALAIRREAGAAARRQRAGRRRRARGGARRRVRRSADADAERSIEAMAHGLERDRRAARPGRRDHRPALPPDRHPGRQDARAARRDRHHLRIAAQRDRRRGGAVPQVRQRVDPARRLGSDPQQPRRSPRCVREGLRDAGLPETAVQLVDDDRPRRGGPPDHRRRARRRHRAARRQGADRARRARSARAGDQAPRRRLPRLRRRRAPTSSMAVRIADNAKTQRYAPCNTMETLLVHADDRRARAAAARRRSTQRKGVEMRGDERARALVPAMKPATEEDWYAEYLAPILAIRVVDSLDAAIDAHRALRLAAHRRDRHRGPRATRCASCARSIRAR